MEKLIYEVSVHFVVPQVPFVDFDCFSICVWLLYLIDAMHGCPVLPTDVY